MAFDTILSKLKTPEKPPSETFFALEVTAETIKSAVWWVENKQTQVLKVGQLEEWREQDKESFLKAVDASISSAGEGIVPEPTGVLFGLPEDWVNKDEILPQRKELLRQISQKLELRPLGFVITVEALVQHFKAQQGTPLNGILIRVGETDLLVSLVVVGKVKGSELVGRTEDLVADVKEGLARFSEDNLPPRMILYNGLTDFEDAKQQLLSYDWQKELSFLHFPKIESLPTETSIRAVAVAGGSEVAKSLGLEVKEPEAKEETEEEKTVSAPKAAEPESAFLKEEEPRKAEALEKPEIEEKKAIEETEEEAAETSKEEEKSLVAALGFVKGEDILVKAGVDVAKRVSQEKDIDAQPAVPSDQIDSQKKAREAKTESPLKESAHSIKMPPKEEPGTKSQSFPLNLFTKILGGLKAGWGKIKQVFGGRPLRLPLRSVGGLAVLIGAVFVALVVGGLAFYWYVPKAEVTVYVAPKLLEKELTFTVSTEASSINAEQAIIPGQTQEVKSQGNMSVETSGAKLVGDAASGSVTIYNKTDSAHTFEVGTVLLGPDNLVFELADDVTVASQSAHEEGTTYGKATVQAEAADIGPEYNLSADTSLTLKDYSSSRYTVTTEEGFSGGTSREIQAVSKEDQERLLEKLTQQLKVEAEDKLESQVGGNQMVLAEAIKSEVVDESFNHEVGDEASQLSLDLTVNLTALSFSQNDLNTLLLHQLSGSIPEEFQLTTDEIETEVEAVDIEDSQARVKVIAKVKLLPQYDLKALKDDLVGKYPPLVQGHLSSLPNFVKADIRITPKLPGKLGTLPRVKDNINIKIEGRE